MKKLPHLICSVNDYKPTPLTEHELQPPDDDPTEGPKLKHVTQ